MSIIITKRGDAPVRVERSLIEQEDYLQRTVYENPESIPLHELKDDIRLLVLAREFPTGSGPIDALGIDADGDVYVIETKLYKNADKRRVVAQMLDYGASLWSTYSEPTAFTREIERALQKSSSTPLAEKLAAFYDLADDERVNEIVGAIERNVSEGRFRFVVLMDRLDDRLRDMIRFVNQNSRFDILGVELDFYQHGEFEIIIPNLFGAEIRKEVESSSGRPKRTWDEERFFGEAVHLLSPEKVSAMRSLYDWATASADAVAWGSGAKTAPSTLGSTTFTPPARYLRYSPPGKSNSTSGPSPMKQPPMLCGNGLTTSRGRSTPSTG